MKTRSILTLLLTLGLCAGAAEAKGHKNGLKKADTNGDHQISLAEFQAASKKPEKAKAKFEKLDTNHDGQLDKSELAGAKKDGKKGGGKKEGKKGGGKKHKGGKKK